MSETFFVKRHRKDNFTILDNTCIRDDRISWKAKGVHTYLMSLPDDWKIHISEIVNHSSDGKAALYSAIQMLEEYGYIKKIRNRRKDGCFENTVYQVFESPEVKDADEDAHPLTDFPDVDNPDMENPVLDNRTLLTTKKLNTDTQKTVLTNLHAKEKTTQTVSESFFVSIIKGLFSGQYPFDKNFEFGVRKHLSYAEIDEVNLESYLKYVFDRTKLGKVKKSFEGLYRTLALSKSIIIDFKNSNFIKKPEETKKAGGEIKHVDCPICSTRFDKINFSCPTCGLSLREMSEPLGPEFIVKKTLYEMSESERQKYESALSDRAAQIKLKTGRTFLLENEKIHFWKDYGILDE
ncbi:hypothetical protein [Treponema sp.]|uniref:hypothetical protein n=2 Tax=Treponema TaxID=157 RepID=UPI0025E728E1|nr:hypothetical protein [Treponema sp.]MBR4321792.1 hypothetical protein [Treponema sp.]